MIKDKIFYVLLAMGIVLRLVLAVTTYHSDIGALALSAKYIAGEGKIFSFYDAVVTFDESGEKYLLPSKMVFHYQPMAYLIPSIFYLPFRQVILNTADSITNNNWSQIHSQSYNWLLLLYKFPLIMFDIFILLLLPNFFSNKKDARLAQILWLFNPLGIYVSSMMGQVDIIIAFWLLLAYKFLLNRRHNLSVFFVTISALIKPIGLILIPIILIDNLHKNKNIFKVLLTGFVGLFTYIGVIFPYISSPAYRVFSLFADHINKTTYAGIAIASGTQIPWFFIFYGLILLLFWKNRMSALTCFMATLLSSLVFTHFHPQWLTWVMPFLLIWSIKTGSLMIYAVSVFSWFCVLFSFDPTLHYGIFLASKTMIEFPLRIQDFMGQIILMGRAMLIGILLYLLVNRKRI